MAFYNVATASVWNAAISVKYYFIVTNEAKITLVWEEGQGNYGSFIKVFRVVI